MVELEPITDEDEALELIDHQGGDMEGHGMVDVMHDLSRYDEQRLKLLLGKHHRLTGSIKAASILDNWDSYRSRFVKVMPVEYRKALQKMQEQADGEKTPDASVAVGA